MTMASYTTFFGDGEVKHANRAYARPLIRELKRDQMRQLALAAIANRVIFARHFSQTEISETDQDRALIGGGMAPKRAQEMIAAYVDSRPLIETYELCRDRFWSGP